MLLETAPAHTGYVVKVYPRFSETFIVTEVLAREAAGENLSIYATRPTSDARFHPELARVQAPVAHLRRVGKASEAFFGLIETQRAIPGAVAGLSGLMPLLERVEPIDFHQGLELARRVDADGVTHLHAHFATAAARVAAIAAHLTGITWSVTCHAKDIFHESVDEQLLKELLTRATCVVTISEYNRRHLLRRFPQLADRLELVRNGLDLRRFPYRDPRPVTGPLRVVSVGRLVEKKGLGVLIEAARRARAAGISLEVRIAGDGDQAAQLRAQIEDHDLTDIVQLLGPRSQAEVVELLDWADVMAAPCVVGADGNADGLPTVLLEAMAMGVVAISTDVTGIPEAVHPATGGEPATGVLLPQGDVDALADALIRAAEPDFPRVELARAARSLIETDYDTAKQATRLADLVADARLR